MTDFAQHREEALRRAVARFGSPVPEESIRRAVARKEEFIRQLLADAGRPDPVELSADEVPGLRDFVRELEDVDAGGLSYAEIKRAAQLPLHQITSRREAEGLHGLPVADLPDEVADFVKKVAALMGVKPESQWLFVKGHEHWDLPEGAYCLISEGTHASPFTWWLDVAVLNGFVGEPAGWRVRATDAPGVVGIYPV